MTMTRSGTMSRSRLTIRLAVSTGDLLRTSGTIVFEQDTWDVTVPDANGQDAESIALVR